MSQTTNDLEELRKRLIALQNPAPAEEKARSTRTSQQARLDGLERRVQLLEDQLLRLGRALRSVAYAKG